MGTWSYSEDADSRSWRFEERWRDQTLERKWKLFWTPANGSDPYPGDAAIRTNLPVRPQQRLESAVYGTDGVLKRYVCRSVTVEPLREANYSWTVRATFTTEVFPWEASDAWGKEFVKQTRVVGSRAVSMYVQGATLPTDGDVSWPPSAGITTGSKVDLNGNPRQYNVAQQQVTIENIRDRTASTTTADDPPWTTVLTSYVNKRNDAAFLGWPIGSVLCTGITATSTARSGASRPRSCSMSGTTSTRWPCRETTACRTLPWARPCWASSGSSRNRSSGSSPTSRKPPSPTCTARP